MSVMSALRASCSALPHSMSRILNEGPFYSHETVSVTFDDEDEQYTLKKTCKQWVECHRHDIINGQIWSLTEAEIFENGKYYEHWMHHGENDTTRTWTSLDRNHYPSGIYTWTIHRLIMLDELLLLLIWKIEWEETTMIQPPGWCRLLLKRVDLVCKVCKCLFHQQLGDLENLRNGETY